MPALNAKTESGEWSAAADALWLEKDRAELARWADEKRAEYKDGKRKEKYPTEEDLEKWISDTCQKSKDSSLNIRANPRVFFDVKIGEEMIGRITMTLREDKVPKTAENFRQLCLRDEGEGYKNSIFHRVIPGFMCQGGDFTNHNGTGGKSIYGEKFEDENFALKHTGEGILSMANAGPGTNGSQFFLCTSKTEWLNGKHVVFGKVIDGLDVVKKIEAVGSESGSTSKEVRIADCGELAIDQW